MFSWTHLTFFFLFLWFKSLPNGTKPDKNVHGMVIRFMILFIINPQHRNKFQRCQKYSFLFFWMWSNTFLILILIQFFFLLYEISCLLFSNRFDLTFMLSKIKGCQRYPKGSNTQNHSFLFWVWFLSSFFPLNSFQNILYEKLTYNM